MKISQVAVQLYTLRDVLKTRQEVEATLKKVRAIGYPAVQISGVSAPLDPTELAKMISDAGLICCATHEGPEMILDEPQKVVEILKKLNCQYTAYPWPSNIDLTNAAIVEDFAKKLDAAGAILRQAGQVLTYHNHAMEFVRYKNTTVLDYLYSATDPKNLQGEIDTYWVQFGGGDVVEWCEKLKNRLPLLHLKDFGATHDNKIFIAEIGNGNLNFKKIISAAEKSGTKWFIVEQDTCPGDPFDSLKQSYDYIQANLVS